MDLFLDNKLEIINLTKSFEEGDIIKTINFDVKNGEFLSILGPSGCGKTTLLRMIIGLLKPDNGTILKDGKDITNLKPDKRNMGIVFQNYALFENMNVAQNIEYALKFHDETRNNIHEIADNVIRIVGLEEHKNKMPKNLSGGQQQRVAIARTLALNPEVILFDEPMSALDASTRIAMRKEIKEIQRKFNTTIIYVTHDQEEAFSMSDRIMILDHGVISQLDTPQNIINNPANEYIKTFVIDNLKEKVDSLSKFKL